VRQAKRVLRQRKPELVIGLGGFAAGPGGLAARNLKIPLVIHEQNALAGLTNRFLARFAIKVYTGFDGAFVNKKIKTETVGNPLRESFVQAAKVAPPSEQNKYLRILVVGGSLGASALNEIVPKAVALLPPGEFEIWHQTGEKTLVMTQDHYQQMNVTANVVSFIDDMPAAYQWADVVICRAGALTVSELAAMGKAAILVPLPTAADDHQRYNAQWLSKHNAGICILQKDLTPEHLAEQLIPWLRDRDPLIKMGKCAKQLARLDATGILVKRCEQLLDETKSTLS
jgi:UDP-N-acetylglucosamine--N-acetylmuramyl-(pentapeptide) pyrophosphoryl-undecaprenol N-acetylglucosamine transferase